MTLNVIQSDSTQNGAAATALTIQEVPPKDYHVVSKTAFEWAISAFQKQNFTSPVEEPDAYKRFIDNFRISGVIGGVASGKIFFQQYMKYIQSQPANSQSEEVRQQINAFNTTVMQQCQPYLQAPLFVCKDALGQIQGIACAEETDDGINGLLLVTNPKNIRAKINGEVKLRIGEAFLKFAQAEAEKRKQNKIFLTPSSSAVSFYEKFGFQKNGKNMTKSLETPQSKL